MEKTKSFLRTIFDSEFIEKAVNSFIEISGIENFEKSSKYLQISLENESWRHDSLEEFLADYRKNSRNFYISISNADYKMSIVSNNYPLATIVTIQAPTRKDVEKLFNLYEQNALKFFIELTEKEKIEADEEEENINPKIFIGHGRSEQWRDLKDHLHEKHNYEVIAYETGARAGHSIRDILESMLDESSFALLVLTGEDKISDGSLQARQNVIHEAGLFQGSLGFNRAIILLEEGTKDFSNIHGIQQIRYSKNNIKETFGEVLATLKREFE